MKPNREPIILFALLLCDLSLIGKAQKINEKPNIIFILADDLGWADLGYTGSKFHETPNIDQLATEGMVFTNAYAACPVCSPSRAAIMSGKSPARLILTDYIPGNQFYGPHKDRKPSFGTGSLQAGFNKSKDKRRRIKMGYINGSKQTRMLPDSIQINL